MGDLSDSDEELMKSLGAFGGGFEMESATCTYCDTEGATFACPVCRIAMYCDRSCSREDFTKHRPYCMTYTVPSDEEEVSDDYAEESSESSSDSEEEEKQYRRSHSSKRSSAKQSKNRTSSSRASKSSRAVAAAANNSSMIPLSMAAGMDTSGLTAKQVKKLMQLSASNFDADKQKEEINQIRDQMKRLVQQSATDQQQLRNSIHQNSSRNSVVPMGSGASSRKRDIEALQKKIQMLERRTSATTTAPSAQVIYTPLLVKDDDIYKKFFKLQQLEMSEDQIKMKMLEEGLDPNLLNCPNEVSPNDQGPPVGAYVPLKVGDDPKFRKYFKLLNMSMPINQIKMKMEVDGVDPALLHQPNAVSPNDPGPVSYQSPPAASVFNSAVPSVVSAVPYDPLLVKDDPAFQKYFKLCNMGMDAEHVKLKMKTDGVDPALFDTPDAVSPNDKGPMTSVTQAATTPAENNGGEMSMQQLYALVMQHQQVIQSGSVNRGLTSEDSSNSSSSLLPNVSVEDQMAAELAAASDAVDDIFGDEEAQGSSGGMTLVQQLDKKARKEANRKLVDNREEINATIQALLTTQFTSESDAVSRYKVWSSTLEKYGLSLGSSATQSWSARLLIKNKETRDWYYSESERLDAGRAYGRLWALSTLVQCSEQLRDKELQIRNAPETLKSSIKSYADLIDKYIQLLKDSVKLKHKIFKSRQFSSEIERMNDFKVPQSLNAQGESLTSASSVLASSAMDMAEEEFRILEKTVRGKTIKAYSYVHVVEKAIHLVSIVKKLGVTDVDDSRVGRIQETLSMVKETYLSTKGEEEEEEDDVL